MSNCDYSLCTGSLATNILSNLVEVQNVHVEEERRSGSNCGAFLHTPVIIFLSRTKNVGFFLFST